MEFPELKDINEEEATKFLSDPDFVVERKRDGTAAMLICKDEIQIIGRGETIEDGGKHDYTQQFPEIEEAADGLVENYCILLGEIVVMKIDGSGNEDFQLLQTRLNRKTEIGTYAKKYPTKFIAFDCLEFEGTDLTNLPFKTRREYLERVMKNVCSDHLGIIPQAVTTSHKEFYFHTMRSSNWEGVVIKNLVSPYLSGQFRYKLKKTYDVYTYGEVAKWGQGKYEGLIGSVVCYQQVNGKEMKVGNVGGGFTLEQRKEMTRRIKDGLISKSLPSVWIIQSHEILKSGKFRYPNFIEERYDKAPNQCTRSHEFIEEKPVKKYTCTLEEWI